MPRIKKVKPKVHVFKTLNTDLSTYMKIRIDQHTEVYVKPGQNIDEVRARYLNHNKLTAQSVMRNS